MERKNEPEAAITLRFAETELLIKALDKLDDADKRSVTHSSLMKRLIGIRDFWKNQEKQRKAHQTRAALGKRTRNVRTN